ncbi:EFCAB14 isoform 3, partial [Pan troglodytes]
ATSELDNKTHSENLKQMGDRSDTLKRESLDQVTNRTDTVKIQSIKFCHQLTHHQGETEERSGGNL